MHKQIINNESLSLVIGNLGAAFKWDSTPQGRVYWLTVMANLEAIQRDSVDVCALREQMDRLQEAISELKRQLA